MALIFQQSRAVCWGQAAHPYFLNKPQVCPACSRLPRAVRAGTGHSAAAGAGALPAWPMVVCVDGPKPSGVRGFGSWLRPDFLWALWKI